jgi:hypothetical protein
MPHRQRGGWVFGKLACLMLGVAGRIGDGDGALERDSPDRVLEGVDGFMRFDALPFAGRRVRGWRAQVDVAAQAQGAGAEACRGCRRSGPGVHADGIEAGLVELRERLADRLRQWNAGFGAGLTQQVGFRTLVQQTIHDLVAGRVLQTDQAAGGGLGLARGW